MCIIRLEFWYFALSFHCHIRVRIFVWYFMKGWPVYVTGGVRCKEPIYLRFNKPLNEHDHMITMRALHTSSQYKIDKHPISDNLEFIPYCSVHSCCIYYRWKCIWIQYMHWQPSCWRRTFGISVLYSWTRIEGGPGGWVSPKLARAPQHGNWTVQVIFGVFFLPWT